MNKNNHRIFHWLAIQGCIPVKLVVPFGHETNCVWCFVEVESVDHLLLHCPRSFDIWTALFKWWSILWTLPSSLADFTNDWNSGMGINGGKFWRLLGPCTIWAIWNSRNKAVFCGEFSCWAALVRTIKLKVFLWACSARLCRSHDYHIWLTQPWVLISGGRP